MDAVLWLVKQAYFSGSPGIYSHSNNNTCSSIVYVSETHVSGYDHGMCSAANWTQLM